MLNFIQDSPAFIYIYRRKRDPEKRHDCAIIFEEDAPFYQIGTEVSLNLCDLPSVGTFSDLVVGRAHCARL